ncbi:MAG: glycosyltransferase family 4 protein [Acidimicrobiia bacterium]
MNSRGGFKVAFDATPLVGPLTGIGQFVRQATAAVRALDDAPELVPYIWSLRAPRSGARLFGPAIRRVRFPASVAVRLWPRVDFPRARRTFADVDVVHGTNFIAPPTGKPTVLTIHDCSFVTAPDRVVPVVRAFGPVVRKLVANGAYVHAPSEFVAGQVREIFATNRVKAIPHGAPALAPVPFDDLPELPGLDGKPYLVAVGTSEPRKNFPRLIGAFGLLHQTHPDLCLVLAGPDGSDRPAIDAAVAALPRSAAEHVLFAGWLDEPHRNAVVARAQALVYPSLDEGFGLPAVEAMALGTPVVAADAGALPEVVGNAAVLVDPLDEASIATGVTSALDRRDELIALGHRRLEAFSWSRSAEALVALYRLLVP